MRGITELPGNFGFLNVLDVVALDAAPEKVWIPVAQVGTWFNPNFGEVPITRDDLARMFANFKSGAHPIKPVQLPIDYEHLSTKKDRKPGDGEAAGWFEDLDLRSDGLELWGLVEWVGDAKEKIKAKKYRYFSPTFHPNWVGLNSSKELGPTLIGGALTNYPTLPGCVITCSMEDGLAVRKPASSHTEDPNMKTVKVKNAKGEDVEVSLESLGGISLDTLSEAIPAVKDLRAKSANAPDAADAAKVQELSTQITTLSSEVNTLKTAAEKYKADAEAAATKQKDLEAKALDQELVALEASGYVLPAEKDELKELATSNRTLFDKMIARRKTGKPLVALNTQHGSTGAGPGGDAIKEFDALVEQHRKDNPKDDYATAMQAVAAKRPDLAEGRRVAFALAAPVGPGGMPMIVGGAV